VRTLKTEGRARLAELRTAGHFAELERFTREQEAALAAREGTAAASAGRPEPSPERAALRIGDVVAVSDRGMQGCARAWIQRGAMRFEVPTAQLRTLGREPPPTLHIAVARAADDGSARELSLIGLRAGEALERLERFLDRAVQGGHDSVRIIHGVGSGALRRAVHDYLSASPYCAGFRGGESSEGGTGVTIATLHA
jgi:DNA mismatch repair protein MutS2